MARKNSRAASGSGSIRQRKDGTWEGRFTYKDEFGRSKRHSVYASTQKECRKKLTAAIKAVDEGAYKPPTYMTVSEWLDTWLDTYCQDLKPRAYESYRSLINTRIKPVLGDVKMASLANINVQRFINSLSQGDKPLSPKSVRNVHGVLHKALEQAIVAGIRLDNPADRIKLPKLKKADLHPLMDEDIARFIEAIKGDRFEFVFLLALFSGMRQSELLGLQWDDIDFDAGTITVCRQLQREYGGNSYCYIDSAKNGKTRTVSIAPAIVELLRQIRRQQTEWQLAAGPIWDNPDGLIFTDELGEHLKHHTVYNHFKRIVKQMGKPEVRFHDLRHSYAISALQIGDSPNQVKDQLGHYSSAFTMDTYAEISKTMRKESQDRMETFIKQVSDL